MIHYVRGDLFESPAQTLVNTVNTVGVMGKGIAYRFKRIYPEMFEEYRRLCESQELDIGRLHLWTTPHKLVLNFPTKTTWRQPSRPSYIEKGLQTFVRTHADLGIDSVAFPPLGCGNGELDFATVVRPLMHQYLHGLPIDVFVYAPLPGESIPEHRKAEEIDEWLRGYPQDLPFSEVWRDLQASLSTRARVESLSGGVFEAQLVDAGDDGRGAGVRVWSTRSSRATAFLEREFFAELWKELRVRPLLTAANTPRMRDQTARYAFALLTRLDYVRRVSVGEEYDLLRFNAATAVYLVRNSEHPDRQLDLALA